MRLPGSNSGPVRQRDVIRRIANATAAILDLEDLLDTAYREISRIFQTDTFFVALYDDVIRQIEFPLMIDEGARTAVEPVPLGQGLTSHVIAGRESLLLRTKEEAAQVARLPKLYGSMKMSESWLGVPLIIADRLIGVVNVQSYQPGAYTEEHRTLLRTIADLLAVGIEHARLHEQVSRRAEQMAVVNEVSRRITSRLEPGELLRTAVELIRDRLGYDQVMYLDCEGDRVTVRIGVGPIADIVPAGSAIPPGAGLIGRVTRSAQPALVRCVAEDPDYYNPNPDVLLTQSELVVPVTIAGSIVGVLDLQSNEIDAFDETDQLVLETLADQCGVALETARLYQAMQTELHARREAEQRVARYVEELESANEEIKQFAYIVSHDLRAPLVNLKGFAAELREAMTALSPHIADSLATLPESEREPVALLVEEDVPEALGFIESSVARMDAFINAVLKLSRIGRRELKPEPLDVQAIATEIRSTLAHQLDERGAVLTIHNLPDVVADRTALEQVFGNLLANAVNYLEPTRAGIIEVGGERRATETEYWIKDNGRGIAEDDYDKVFAPFRRAGKQDVAGEGMGLSYVRTMVKRMSGTIGFESQLDLGTTFTFTIGNPTEKR